MTLGAALVDRPDFQGAADHRLRVAPMLSVAYGDLLVAGPRGLELNLLQWGGFRAGPLLGYEHGRSGERAGELGGVGKISASVTGGAFAAYRKGPFEASVSLRQAITHAGNGLSGRIDLNYRTKLAKAMELTIGPDLSFADANYERTWFGVTLPMGAALGVVSPYAPGGGLKDVGAHAAINWRASAHVLVRGFAGVEQLTSDAAKSPIVEEKTQSRFGLGLAYRF